ncbi:MAG: serine/threonine protein kinase [Planctomycetota bacterium]
MRSHETALSQWKTWMQLAAFLTAILLLLTISFWTVYRSEQALNANVTAKLQTVSRIENEAVRQWLNSEVQLLSLLASDSQLAKSMTSASAADASNHVQLESRLQEISRQLQNKTCLLMTTGGKVVASSGDSWLLHRVRSLESQFCESFVSGETKISSLPHGADVDDAQVPYGLVITAPIAHPEQGIVGFLGIGYDLRDELTRVLRSSRSGASIETLAVTPSGFLVSQSRFESAQERLEFVDRHGLESHQTVSGFATIDLVGQADHRGVDTVFASCRIPKLGLALVTKMDLSEATAPITQIRRFVWTLFGFIVLTTLTTLFYRWYVFTLRINAKRQELERKRLGAYELENKLGEGGMGVVYRAKHALMRRPTAIKILPPERSSPIAIERFEREVQFTSQLKHPNTISIYDYGRTQHGLFYYAMELLDGMNLEQLVRREEGLPDGRVQHVLLNACQSLGEAHSLGLIHRDIKPANIMLCDRGGAFDTVKVLDFGMVRERSSDAVEFGSGLSGTPIYMAPECFADPASIDASVDIFAIGAVGYFLLTGKPLLDASDLNELLQFHQSDLREIATRNIRQFAAESGRPISEELIELVACCVATQKEDRPASVEAVIEQLTLCQPSVVWDRTQAQRWWNSLNNETNFDTNTSPTSNDDSPWSLNTTQIFEPTATVKPNDKQHRLRECETIEISI